MHIRESLKEIDELLKCIKNKTIEKLKEVEQKLASIGIELDSVSNKSNKYKYTIYKLFFAYKTYSELGKAGI